ncbi:YheC/YheD family protein [Neobacillus dielmonensis]|uniref:YheC/YheD family protein n=1 Tax=Neobacillus dielmonensis TaxID=1347369 RepID=UPI0005A64EAF|nr:YheC/YheD family protein [Neobacillus dielmonensis]
MSQNGRFRFSICEDIGLNEIVFPESIRQVFDCKGEPFVFHYGSWWKYVEVTFSSDVKGNTIAIHPNLTGPYTLPIELEFNVKIKERQIFIGPVIAFIFRRNEKSIIKRLRRFLDYTRHYQEFAGLLFFCAAKSIDINDQKITGYYFIPDQNGTGGTWSIGTFPFPETAFRRCRGKEVADLSEQIPGKVFNDPLLDKWEIYDRLSSVPEVCDLLPETIRLTGKDSVMNLLEKHKAVYVKPILGRQADGIYKISKEMNHYVIEDTTGKREVMNQLDGFINKLGREKRSYILQQPVENPQLKRNIVFRLILQKGYEKVWMHSGSYVRVGHEGKIATNRHLTETFMTTSQTLQSLYKLTNKSTIEKEHEMILSCKEVCQVLERADIQMADVAFDVMLDASLNIMILEINQLSHNHKGPLQTINNKEMYELIVSNPLQYAAALAGYGRT